MAKFETLPLEEDKREGTDTVTLQNGATFVLTKKGSSVSKNPDEETKRTRTSLLNTLALLRVLFARELTEAEGDYLWFELKANNSRSAPKFLVSPLMRRLAKQRAKAIAGKTSKKIYALIQNSIEEAIKKELKSQNKVLKRIGFEPLSNTKLVNLSAEIIKPMLKLAYPGTKLNTEQRSKLLSALMVKHMEHPINATVSRRSRAVEMMRESISGTKAGPSPLRGGSVIKGAMRIARSEQARVTRYASLRLGEVTGVELVYWRLSSAHKWHGGGESCERLAEMTGPGVVSLLASKNKGGRGINTRGLYTLGGYPNIPHAHCMCYPEFIYVE